MLVSQIEAPLAAPQAGPAKNAYNLFLKFTHTSSDLIELNSKPIKIPLPRKHHSTSCLCKSDHSSYLKQMELFSISVIRSTSFNKFFKIPVHGGMSQNFFSLKVEHSSIDKTLSVLLSMDVWIILTS